MGQFTSFIYNTTTESIIQGYQNRVNAANPYYRFTDKKPSPVTYWNINSTHTTLDCGIEQAYDQLTDEDPIRYNRINGFYLYGLGRIETNISIGEYGPEANPIEGEAYILPNTIIPFEGDYFTIDYLINDDKYILFRILEVNRDTLENGANFYRIHYKLDQVKREFYDYLIEHTVKTFKYIPSSVGTNFVALLDDQTEASINQLSKISSILRQYYIDLFYKRNIQTFVYPYEHGCMLLYDPYLIEFLIRNKIFVTEDELYLYVSQATFRSSTFSIEYAKTLFLNIENRDPELSLNTVWPIQICDPNSLLIDRMEEYLELSVQRQNFNFHNPVNFLSMDLFDRIVNNNLYDETDPSSPCYRNIIIDYMNKNTPTITESQLKSLEQLKYARNKIFFYEIPLLIHAINSHMNDLMTNPMTSGDQSTSTITKCGKKCFVNGD